MTASFESKSEETELSIQDLPKVPTVKEMEAWDNAALLKWIQQKKPNLLRREYLDKFRAAEFLGETFLRRAGNVDFFMKAGLPLGVSEVLANLGDEVKEEDKLSKQTAGRKRKGDETDAPESPISPKRNRQEDPSEQRRRPGSEIDGADDDLLERVERAVKRRARILQDIKTISQLPDTVPLPDAAIQLSNAAVPLPSAELSHAVVQLSSPAIQIKLPFPFVGHSIPERFDYDGDHDYWDYMGREKFTELLNAVNVLQTTGWRGYMFYGTIGYGKSHLLAALACYLISTGKRVIYIPDCRACAWRPVPYFQAAMLLAWGGPDDSDIRKEIIALNTTEAISKFFGRQLNIFFLVDQMNALERDPSGTDGLSDERKRMVYEWIRECAAPHKYIFSASANNQNRGWTDGKQTGARQLLVHGGFSAAEMQKWWDRNEKLIPEHYTKDEVEVERFKSKVEDLTGSIPLLLRECVVNEKIDLSADTLKNVAKQVRTFMKRLRLDANTTPETWDTHCEYVRACINGQAVMDDTPSNLIDNRYFFAEAPGLIGKYACGIAREAAARQLRRYKVDKFGDTDFWMALNDHIDNPSVTGFFIEQAILSSIASRGLEISEEISKKMDTVMFSGAVPKFNTTKSGPVLYCPINFNFHGIDGMIVRFTKGKCFMFPLQITVAKFHSDSEEVFFSEWDMWTNRLHEFEVVPVFVWITKEDSGIDTVSAEYRSTRSGMKLVRPSYRRQKIPLERVNLDISERYQRALGKLQDNVKSWVQNERLGDNQAPLDASETEDWKGRGKSGDRITGGEEQRESKEPEGAEEQARSGRPSTTAGLGVPEAKESGGKGGRREDYMKKKVPGLRELLKNRSKPWTGTKSQLVDRLLEEEEA